MVSTFPGVLAFAFLASMLLVGSGLRARIPLFQNALVPASLLGGLVGFLLLLFDLDPGFESSDFGVLAFHFFTLSFMSLVLTGDDKSTDSTLSKESQGKTAKSTIAAGGMWFSVVWTMSLVLQGLVGLLVVKAYNGASGETLSEFLGMIATHGFTQGPGQALAMGNIWQETHGIENAVNFGVIYASAGFLAAFVIGVPVARWAVQKGLNANSSARLDDDFVTGIFASPRRPSAGDQVTHPANLDSLAYHLGFLGVAYLLTNEWLEFIGPIAQGIPMGESNFGTIFNHNLFFLHGLMICLVLRSLLNRLGFGHLIDNNSQRRITGASVDFMVVATLMAVQVSLLAAYWLPILLVCVFLTLATVLLCFGFGRLLGDYGVERSLTMYGCCCGSTGSGIVLLRILDPDLSTPIARELAFFNVAIILVSFHILGLTAPFLPTLSPFYIYATYGGTFVVGALIAIFGFRSLRRVAAN